MTDADLVLGYLNPNSFLGGTMRLDVDAARAALAEPASHSVSPPSKPPPPQCGSLTARWPTPFGW